MTNDLLYQVALTLVPHIGAVQARALVEHFGNAEDVFKASKKQLACIENIGEVRAASIREFDGFALAEEEVAFIEKYHIQTMFLKDAHYPRRLLHCYDAPVLLYFKGHADFNTAKVVSVIGTRNNTDYGKYLTEHLIKELQLQDILIVSGLAFGIDAIAHKTALQHHIPTVGVLAHGLDIIYPAQHKSMAKEMLAHGGLLTEMVRNTKPDKHNFPRRNRIVAGLADATIVVETAVKGGSMITAEIAHNYNRDVFAFPGKTTDSKSAGCNHLIRQNKATLVTCAADLLDKMGWLSKKNKAPVQRALFAELSPDEKTIVALFQNASAMHIDELYIGSGLSSSTVAACILNLELQGVMTSLPGKMYRLC